MRIALASAVFALSCAAADAASCVASPPPAAWSNPQQAAPAPLLADVNNVGPLTLVMVRHGEKPLNKDGLMIEDGNLGPVGVRRAQRLPERLLALYGCPDMIVSTDPAVKIHNRVTGLHFNYIRPLTTIAPFSGAVGMPVWTPYGFNQTENLVQDLIADKAFAPKADGTPKTIIIAWEHMNIVRMKDELLKPGRFTLATGTMKVGRKTWTCEVPPAWPECDFDSIWVMNLNKGQACFTRQFEKLNSPAFQKACKGDVRAK